MKMITSTILDITALTITAASLLLSTLIANAQTSAPAQPGPTFTQAQVDAGNQAYEQHCASCHGYGLEGFEMASSLKGKYFDQQWAEKNVSQLLSRLHTMPPTAPNSLSEQNYLDIASYLLQQNGVLAGTKPLPNNQQALAKLLVPKQDLEGRESFPPAQLRYGSKGPLVANSRLDDLQPVNESVLENPSADDWLMWRRSYDTLGFSPLKAINRNNVSTLTTAWTWSLPPGANMMAPIVHNGVLFAYSFGDIVEALDAKSGELLWSYQHTLSDGYVYNSKKGVAIYDNKILVPTSDMHLLALDARTGQLLWDHAIDVGSETSHWMKSAPLIVKGKAIIGLTGQVQVEGGNFIVAIDLNKGEEAWRFYTVARPGEANGNSWNGLPLEKRTGGSVWNPGTYDPDLNLVYFGPAPTYDTQALRQLADRQGITNDALYTNTTIALNPDTGKLVWHYQHLRNDQLDHDWAFERQIITLPINGKPRKVVVTGGKQAIFEGLDAATGEYLFSIDLDMQNVITAIDPRSGKKTINPAAIPQLSQELPGLSMPGICPNALGARNLQATAYNPGTGLLFVPLSDTCLDSRTGQRWQKNPQANSDGLYGILKAVNLQTKDVVWTQREVAPSSSAVLATAGDIIFSGTVDRWFKALDQRDGKILWQHRLNNAPSSFPITYSVDGKQYIAVATNRGAYHVNGMARLAKANNPPTGAALMVFALPE